MKKRLPSLHAPAILLKDSYVIYPKGSTSTHREEECEGRYGHNHPAVIETVHLIVQDATNCKVKKCPFYESNSVNQPGKEMLITGGWVDVNKRR